MASITSNALELIRLHALNAMRIMDTPPDPAFDQVVGLAAEMMQTPIALVSLVDDRRQWFKARFGLDVESTPRSDSFCAHALSLDAHSVMVVRDATLDDRFRDNPLVMGEPGIRFYMGALLTDQFGNNLGTLCVIDTVPRPEPTLVETNRLKALASIVVRDLQRTHTERVFSEQKRLLDMAETMSGVGHWRFDVRAGSVLWSDEVYRIHGVDREF